MNRIWKSTALAALALGLGTTAASAATFSYSNDFTTAPGAEWDLSAVGSYAQAPGVLGEAAGSGFSKVVLKQTSAGASTSALNGTLAFDFLGYRTLDGYNCCTDELVLKVNGSELFRGAFSLGGGGSESFVSAGSTTVTSVGNGRRISLLFTAIAGVNTFDFTVGPGMEGIGNEAYALDNVSFSAEVASSTAPVPEPGTWALMILGFGAAGAALRARRLSLA